MISPSSLSAFSVLRPAATPPATAAARPVQLASAASVQAAPLVGQRPAQPDPTARRGSLLDRMA